MKTIVFSASAAREFDKLPPTVRDRIDAALYAYVSTGRGDVKRLKGFDDLRLRIGEYRIVFQEDAQFVEIVFVGGRKDAY